MRIEDMWPVAKTIYSSTTISVGSNILYVIILLLTIAVFKLGFSKKLPILKSLVVYLFLALGCTVLTLLAAFLPIPESLAIAVLILAIYKIRLYQSKRKEA